MTNIINDFKLELYKMFGDKYQNKLSQRQEISFRPIYINKCVLPILLSLTIR